MKTFKFFFLIAALSYSSHTAAKVRVKQSSNIFGYAKYAPEVIGWALVAFGGFQGIFGLIDYFEQGSEPSPKITDYSKQELFALDKEKMSRLMSKHEKYKRAKMAALKDFFQGGTMAIIGLFTVYVGLELRGHQTP